MQSIVDYFFTTYSSRVFGSIEGIVLFPLKFENLVHHLLYLIETVSLESPVHSNCKTLKEIIDELCVLLLSSHSQFHGQSISKDYELQKEAADILWGNVKVKVLQLRLNYA